MRTATWSAPLLLTVFAVLVLVDWLDHTAVVPETVRPAPTKGVGAAVSEMQVTVARYLPIADDEERLSSATAYPRNLRRLPSIASPAELPPIGVSSIGVPSLPGMVRTRSLQERDPEFDVS